MTKRYGRNQRRKHRGEILELEERIAQQKDILDYRAAQNAKLREIAANARHEAFNQFLNDPERIDDILRHMTKELIKEFGKEGKEAIEKLVNSDRSRNSQKFIDFTVEESFNKEFEIAIIRGEIKPIRYNFAVGRY